MTVLIEVILWFTITVSPQEIMHFPREQAYPTMDTCVNELIPWLSVLEEQFPGDRNIVVYCLDSHAAKQEHEHVIDEEFRSHEGEVPI